MQMEPEGCPVERLLLLGSLAGFLMRLSFMGFLLDCLAGVVMEVVL